MKTKFEHVDGRIYLVVSQMIWAFDSDENDEVEVLRKDVTDDVIPVVDEQFNYKLGLHLYKMTDGKLNYIGEDKDKYNK